MTRRSAGPGGYAEGMQRTLILLRHAKAEPQGVRPDAERHLTPRGWADARDVGLRIAREAGPLAGALVSPAARTRETFAAVLERVPVSWMRTERRIYAAAAEDLLDLARAAGPEESLLLVGHGPAIWEAAALVAEPGEAREQTARGVATGTAMLLRFEGVWGDLGAAPARLSVLPRAHRR